MSLKSIKLYLQQAGFRDLDNLMNNREFVQEATTGWSWSAGQILQGKNAADSFSGAKVGSDIIALRFLGTSSSNSNVIDCAGDAVSADDEYEITLFISTADQLVCKDADGTTVLDEGVEHLRAMYGIDDGSTYRYYNADEVSDWSVVNRVKIALLLAQSVTANHLTNSNDYKLLDRTISAANDTNFRRVDNETILVRNQDG